MATINAFVPDVSEALGEFQELVAYGRKFPDLGQALSRFLYGGSPPFRTSVDFAVAVPATDMKVMYQLVDRLKILLAAGRALDEQSDDVPKGMAHGVSPCHP